MSNFMVPNTFVPGTKARAQEVNENFISVQDEINKKAEKFGDSSQTFYVNDAQDDYQAVNKHQINEILAENIEKISSSLTNSVKSPTEQFLILSANVDSNGKPDVIRVENNIIYFNVDDGSVYAPIVAIPANDRPKFTLTALKEVNTASLPDGTYSIFISEDKENVFLTQNVFIQKIKPATPVTDTVFVNTSAYPLKVEKYNGSEWEEFNSVLLGNFTIKDNKISDYENQNFGNNVKNVFVTETYSSGASWYRLWSDGWCEQGGRAPNPYSTVTLLKPLRKIDNFATLTSTSNMGGPCNHYTETNSCNIVNLTTIFLCSGVTPNVGSYWRLTGFVK